LLCVEFCGFYLVLFCWSMVFASGYKSRFLRYGAMITITLINTIIAKLVCRYYPFFILFKKWLVYLAGGNVN